MNLTKWEILIVILVLMISAFAIASYGQTVSHSAGQILPGTFAAGLYHFVNNLNVSDTLFVDGDLNITGTVYNPSNLYMIVGNLISLISSGNIELNATSGQIDLNSDEVYINHTRVINYTDDSALLEIYAGIMTPVTCPAGFGLAYYGWAYAGAGVYFVNTTNALFGGDLSCIQNSTADLNSLWIEENMTLPAPGVPSSGAGNILHPLAFYLVNETSAGALNFTACTVCNPNGGEYVRIYQTNSSSALSCPAGFTKLFSTDGYIYVAAGEVNASGVADPITGAAVQTSVLTGGGTSCVQYPSQYVSSIATLAGYGGGTLPTYWHASGGDYSRCNICYRPSIIK